MIDVNKIAISDHSQSKITYKELDLSCQPDIEASAAVIFALNLLF